MAPRHTWANSGTNRL